MPGMGVDADPHWPSADSLLSDQVHSEKFNLALVGVPTYEMSLTPKSPSLTPHEVRRALSKFSTYSYTDGVDLSERVNIVDYGDVTAPDSPDGRRRLHETLARVDPKCELLLVLGGDNAATAAVMSDLAGTELDQWGLVTLDAHLDLRDGQSNGSPVRELLDQGLRGHRVVQVGLADFANSPFYAERARLSALTAITRTRVRREGIESALDEALEIAGTDQASIYADFDLDVGDRAEVPACPAALPGGLSADEMRRAARVLGASSKVRAIDFTEVDVERDAPDGRTVRLLALLVLEAAAGAMARIS
jgi:formiminoglutamase